jgi:hypothetical protein
MGGGVDAPDMGQGVRTMSFCNEFAEKKPSPPTPKRKLALADLVAAMEWDLTGLKGDMESLKRSRWWHRLALTIIYLAIALVTRGVYT